MNASEANREPDIGNGQEIGSGWHAVGFIGETHGRGRLVLERHLEDGSKVRVGIRGDDSEQVAEFEKLPATTAATRSTHHFDEMHEEAGRFLDSLAGTPFAQFAEHVGLKPGAAVKKRPGPKPRRTETADVKLVEAVLARQQAGLRPPTAVDDWSEGYVRRRMRELDREGRLVAIEKVHGRNRYVRRSRPPH
jgi:hypothetical protein